MKKVSIATNGSRGDIQPYLAIALALRDAGYDVRFVANIDHVPFVEQYEFEINQVFPSVEEPFKMDPRMSAVMASGSVLEIASKLDEIAKEEGFRNVLEAFLEEMRTNRPDLLVQGSLTEYHTLFAAFFMKIPVVPLKLTVFSFDRKRASFGLPTLPLGLHYYFFTKFLLPNVHKSWVRTDDLLDDERRLTDILPLKKFVSLTFHPQLPTILCTSSLTKDTLYRNADPDKHHFVGACVIESSKQLSDSEAFGADEQLKLMDQFLKSDPSRKPVYCGWGSMICRSPEYMVKLVVKALQISGERGIVLGGWANLCQELLEASTRDMSLVQYAKENILFVEKAPHEWLFPQVACTVHHGGAGTFAAALRSGSPTIITPVFFDQFDYACAVSNIGNGIGFKKQFQKISAEELGAAISHVVKCHAFSERAEYARAHTLAEKGSAGAVAEIERYWQEYVESGRHESSIHLHLEEAGYDSNGNPPSKGKKQEQFLVGFMTWVLHEDSGGVHLVIFAFLVIVPLVLFWVGSLPLFS